MSEAVAQALNRLGLPGTAFIAYLRRRYDGPGTIYSVSAIAEDLRVDMRTAARLCTIVSGLPYDLLSVHAPRFKGRNFVPLTAEQARNAVAVGAKDYPHYYELTERGAAVLNADNPIYALLLVGCLAVLAALALTMFAAACIIVLACDSADDCSEWHLTGHQDCIRIAGFDYCTPSRVCIRKGISEYGPEHSRTPSVR